MVCWKWKLALFTFYLDLFLRNLFELVEIFWGFDRSNVSRSQLFIWHSNKIKIFCLKLYKTIKNIFVTFIENCQKFYFIDLKELSTNLFSIFLPQIFHTFHSLKFDWLKHIHVKLIWLALGININIDRWWRPDSWS